MDLHGSYRLTFVGEGIATALRTMAHLENQTNNFQRAGSSCTEMKTLEWSTSRTMLNLQIK